MGLKRPKHRSTQSFPLEKGWMWPYSSTTVLKPQETLPPIIFLSRFFRPKFLQNIPASYSLNSIESASFESIIVFMNVVTERVFVGKKFLDYLLFRFFLYLLRKVFELELNLFLSHKFLALSYYSNRQYSSTQLANSLEAKIFCASITEHAWSHGFV